MFFASDNTGPVHPQIMQAVADANTGYATPYGDDDLMTQVRDQVRDVFEAPEAAVYLVATGTAANVLSLASLTNPWETVFCTPEAHIHEDECNAPEFYMGGAKLTLVPADNAKMSPDALRKSIQAEESRGVHGPQRGPVSLTNVTERGTVYSVAEIQALTRVAKDYDLPVYMDGARFANALVATNASPAEMTWQAGVDVVSLGGTKNGCMGVEAVVMFDPKRAWEFELRRKRGAHLFSKHRFLSAQMLGYLNDGLWMDLARRANAANARLVAGLNLIDGAAYLYDPQANMGFAGWSRAGHKKLHEAGAKYYVWEGSLEGDDPNEVLTARMVCDWSTTNENVDRFLELARG
ncbi:beta-eliminating lyase-related protein [Aliiroseovarius subalbicans]|uniref:threonine aldolase family protein n=1 Tax=Aliiroseovarius subalbicans TaxID=2925840 RepID=UPI001F588E92|nr:beta-eliminating lyase-related protein [Aliiroseovarius subalbicans]MCI2400623.1 beta-eliminating lyase-related protein [Aliiroseovarius subalbicans]